MNFYFKKFQIIFKEFLYQCQAFFCILYLFWNWKFTREKRIKIMSFLFYDRSQTNCKQNEIIRRTSQPLERFEILNIYFEMKILDPQIYFLKKLTFYCQKEIVNRWWNTTDDRKSLLVEKKCVQNINFMGLLDIPSSESASQISEYQNI